jgi:hypothetical protein
MARSKLAGVFAVLVALTLFLGGMLTYKLLAGTGEKALSGTPTANQSALRSEGVGIQGKVEIRVFNSSGYLVTTWRGHNTLEYATRSAIAGCVSGATTTPSEFGSCSGPWINNIAICATSSSFGCGSSADAINNMLPLGCDPAAVGTCTGWQSTATITIAPGFNSSGYDQFEGTFRVGATYFGFDFGSISPSLSLNVGDRAVVTITFTVS